ncbi:LytR/AlgR family response regulator transcription factor [Olivibacter sitiensis]|uniref:LytR/AlgR family response regulator transcription factor n=1 Tax=Olivibacter sitiensis TaxID=376470 RepID=UPI0004272A22|nr:LytTR family DNA-binding domain-containing protein [Olivibacter sitiensis]
MNERNLTLIIVDDDAHSLRLLDKYASGERDLQVLARFESATEAQDYLLENEVDLLLIDIELPDGNGMDLVAAIPSGWPLVIFITGRNNVGYATRGYRLHAVDYLTKPFSYAHFTEAINKVRQRLQMPHAGQDRSMGSFVLPGTGGREIYYADVKLANVARNDSYIEFMDGEVLKYKISLSRLKEILPPELFIQVSKDFLLAGKLIKGYDSYYVYLRHDTRKFPLGRPFRKSLKAFLEERNKKQNNRG